MINEGMTTTEEAAYNNAMSSTIPGHFEPTKSPTPMESNPKLSDVEIPLHVPPPVIKCDTRPSAFAPMQTTSRIAIPKNNPPTFPLTKFSEWMKVSATCEELLGKLVKSNLLATDIFNAFHLTKKHADEVHEVCSLVNEMKADFQRFKDLRLKIEQQLDKIETCITKSEDRQKRHAFQMIGALPHQTLMKDAPSFFQKRDNWTIPIATPTNPTTQLQMQKDF